MKFILGALILAVVIIGGAVLVRNTKTQETQERRGGNNVHIADGKQIIEIDAKGGYLPRKSIAKAGIPTVIRFNTTATFDCSASVRIPSLDISKVLPQTGSTDIDIGTQNPGPLQGTCGMGMYPFEITFE